MELSQKAAQSAMGIVILFSVACGSDSSPVTSVADMGADLSVVVDMSTQDMFAQEDVAIADAMPDLDLESDTRLDAEVDSGVDTDMGPGSSLVFDTAYEIHHLFCGLAFECGAPTKQAMLEYGRYDSVEDCRAAPQIIIPFLANSFAQSLLAQQEGRIVVMGTEEDLEMCRQERLRNFCEGEGAAPAECNVELVGTVANGEPCGRSNECANGTCDGEVANECYETCVPLSGCDLCTADQFCVYGQTETCVARQELGESCGFAACLPGLVCSASDLCVLPRQTPDGGACERDAECAAGSRCLADLCTSIVVLDLNDACPKDSESSFCRAGTVCAGAVNGMGTCQTPRSRDQPCADTGECYGSLACVGGVCGDLKGVGETCTMSAECVSKLCTGTCLDTFTPDVCSVPQP